MDIESSSAAKGREGATWRLGSDEAAEAFLAAARKTRSLFARHAHAERMADPEARARYARERGGGGGAGRSPERGEASPRRRPLGEPIEARKGAPRAVAAVAPRGGVRGVPQALFVFPSTEA
jgi:hypothetical protein